MKKITLDNGDVVKYDIAAIGKKYCRTVPTPTFYKKVYEFGSVNKTIKYFNSPENRPRKRYEIVIQGRKYCGALKKLCRDLNLDETTYRVLQKHIRGIKNVDSDMIQKMLGSIMEEV
jgi:hypothetical protein